ncbi:MAG: GGDEF domain-containing protein, partial [Lachnospiraceae bacterium]|nr:GGDEF domain-containing protein [Lachnospiraceae bacterium]
ATIGRIINNTFKGRDVAGRIGGDEFMVLLRNIESVDTAIRLAEKLQYEVENAFSGDLTRCVSLSIGIAMCPKHGTKFEELYQAADKALYHVKNNGKASYHIYEKRS